MKIGIFDIETTDLKADFGRILCASILDATTGKITTFRIDKEPTRHGVNQHFLSDKKLCAAIRDELEKYNMIVTWNGKQFDIPFLQARLSKHNERLANLQFHFDPMWYANSAAGLRIGGRSLDKVARFYNIEEEKTRLDPEIWARAAAHDPEAMKYIVDHNIKDVKILLAVYWKLLPLAKNIHA